MCPICSGAFAKRNNNMIEKIIGLIIFFVTATISKYGSLAVMVLMALESANIPIPSEVILTYGGFLVAQGKLNFHLVAFAGAFGCLLGSIVSYYIGLKLGRPFLWRYGKWLLISQKDILRAEKFLEKYGELTYFVSRLLPVVRTFISLVIGISKGSFIKSNLYGFLASWIWSYVLVYVGVKLGANWEIIRPWWDKFSYLIVAIIIGGIVWHVVRVFRDSKLAAEDLIIDKA
ncbi:MAG: hypothetical protein US81_C0044G0001 [Parcubacteria group bacterium GW2011_GWE2_38_18]|nr:MAG: hypothetical protein US81_C0044G0001 [Parcubacteria group bacterium GW2011_GWE2_38_18]